MVHGFYFRFYSITHCIWLSAFLARVAYCLYLLKFHISRLHIKKRIITGDYESAKTHIASVHPDPHGRAVAIEVPFNPDIDLSIIVPVYNYAKLLKANIDSILGQKTRYRYELIIVDDGSTDGSKEILSQYAEESRVNLICQENKGIAAARNTGLDRASGRYITFADCDDILTTDYVETLMSKAYEGDYDIVMCGHDLIKERDGVITSVLPNLYSQANLSGYSTDAAILNYAGLPWCKVYKRELWASVRYLPRYWYEDTIIHALLFTQCKRFAYVPKSCYRYRWYENNFSHTQGKTGTPKSIDRYWMLIPILNKAKELGIAESDCFYTMLLKHLSAYYYPTIRGLDAATVDALFILAQDLFHKYSPTNHGKLPYMLRITEKALKTGDIELWKLASVYQ